MDEAGTDFEYVAMSLRHTVAETSLSWIPSEVMTPVIGVPMDLGISSDDDPTPDRIGDLETLRAADRFRFANHLEARVEVDGDEIVDAGYSGGGMIGAIAPFGGMRI